MKLDSTLLDHAHQILAHFRPGDGHGQVFGRVHSDFTLRAHAAPAQQRFDEKRGLIGRRGAGERRARDNHHYPAAVEILQGLANAQCAGNFIEIERGLRETGHRLGMALGAKGYDQIVAPHGAGARPNRSGVGVDRLNLGPRPFDATLSQPR